MKTMEIVFRKIIHIHHSHKLIITIQIFVEDMG